MGCPHLNSAPQKITAKIQSIGIFHGASFYKRREKNYKEKKKRGKEGEKLKENPVENK